MPLFSVFCYPYLKDIKIYLLKYLISMNTFLYILISIELLRLAGILTNSQQIIRILRIRKKNCNDKNLVKFGPFTSNNNSQFRC